MLGFLLLLHYLVLLKNTELTDHDSNDVKTIFEINFVSNQNNLTEEMLELSLDRQAKRQH